MQKSPLLGRETNQGREPKIVCLHNLRVKRNGAKGNCPNPASPIAPKAVVNNIHGDLVNDRHNSKRQRQRLLRAASIRERVNFVQHNFSEMSVHLIDNTVTFPPVDAN